MENPAAADSSPVPEAAPIRRRGTLSSMVLGALAFGLVSVIAYSLWAFRPGFLPKGEVALYSSIALAYLLLAGLFLHRLVPGERKLLRCYAAFVPAFLVYSVCWTVCYFTLGGVLGETIGSVLGLAALAAILLGALRLDLCWFWECLGLLFLFHTLGYTLGGLCYYSSYEAGPGNRLLAPLLEGHRTLGMLLWGLFHGLGFGAGLGYVFSRSGRKSDGRSVP